MTRIPQLRCNLFIIETEEYDCSLGGNWSIDWSTRGTVQPNFGAYCLMYASLTIPIYLLCARVIWTLRRTATYKILFVLAIADIMSLVTNSVAFGVFLLQGEVYCHHPKIHIFIGIVTHFFFSLSCLTCLILAINRMLELVSMQLCKFIFNGSRAWYLLAVSMIYPIIFAFFTPILPFNSDIHLYSVNPGIYDDDRYQYVNEGHILNNTVLPFLSSIVYTFMLIYLLFKSKSSNDVAQTNALNRATIMLSIQTGIIVVVHTTTGITYALSQYIAPSEAFLYFVQIAWQLLHGIPPFVYLALNPVLRAGVWRYAAPVGLSRLFTTSTSTKATMVAEVPGPKPSVHVSQF